MEKRLKELRNLTQMALDVEMMKLQRIVAAEGEKVAQIRALDATEAERAAHLVENGGADAALYAGADTRWNSWKQREKASLNTQRAALLAKRDEQRLQTQKAFGKDEAVRRLMNQAAEEIKVKSRRT